MSTEINIDGPVSDGVSLPFEIVVQPTLTFLKPIVPPTSSPTSRYRFRPLKPQGQAYTFRDERDLLWYSLVFSSADRESAYVIDGLMYNECRQEQHPLH